MGTEDRYHKTFPVTWDQLHRDCRALAWRLMGRRPWERIVAVARGGLVPAAIVARELDVRVIDTVCVSSYTLRNQGEIQLLQDTAHLRGCSEDWLIVDDLVDTGNTARVVRRMFPEAHFATVYAKPDGRPEVDTYITEVSQDTWILFPWDAEIHVEFVSPIAQQGKGPA